MEKAAGGAPLPEATENDGWTLLLSTQRSLADVLAHSALSIKNVKQWSMGLIEARLGLLNDYWANFQANHMELLRYAPEDERAYVQHELYTVGEGHFLDGTSLLYDARDRLEPPSSALVARDNPPHAHSTGRGTRLPSINIPTFSGRRQDWETFKELFWAMVHEDPQLSDVERLYYLKAHVQGEAKTALETLPTVASNYETAWRLLESRFERRRLLVQDHLVALCNLKALRDESAVGLQGLQDILVKHRDQLRALKQPVEHWDAWFVSLATTCMDSVTLRAWEDELEKADEAHENAEDVPVTFATLCRFLRRCCRSMTSVEATRPSRPATTRTPALGPPPTGRNFRSLATRADNPACPACQASHYLGHCDRFREMDATGRRELITRANLCFNCLKAGHPARSCPSRFTCQQCQAAHHSLLHEASRKRGAGPANDPGSAKHRHASLSPDRKEPTGPAGPMAQF